MDRIIIEGQQPLSGSVKISGAKNAVLPIMAAALMVDGKSVLNPVPDLRDTRTMIKLMEIVGATCSLDDDVLEIHPADASTRGIDNETLVMLRSRKGETTLKAVITENIPLGVVYTTFHNPETGANVVTTENSDWATNCPEYKVTAVEVEPAEHRSEWQINRSKELEQFRQIKTT